MKVIHVLRKPCSEGTVAANVLRWGTGALNIDASRVGYENTQNPATNPLYRKEAGYKNNNAPDTGSSSYSLKDGSGERNPHTGGRWPANLVLQHLDGCRQEGTREVKALGATGSKSGGASGPACIEVGAAPLERRAWVSDNGTETVAAWSCAEGCPIAALDAQSGIIKNGDGTGGTKSYVNDCGQFAGITGNTQRIAHTIYNDTGGASRFFRQVGGSQTTTATPRPPTPGDPSPPGGRRGGG